MSTSVLAKVSQWIAGVAPARSLTEQSDRGGAQVYESSVEPNVTLASQQSLQAQTLTLSKRKLGVFAMQGTAGAQQIIERGPKLMVAFDPQKIPGVLLLVRDYKRMYPRGQVAMRVYDGTQNLPPYTLDDDPAASATHFWKEGLLPAVSLLSSADRELIDYLMGPVEYNHTPPLNSAQEATWVGAFWTKLAELIAQYGLKPILGEIPVGNLDIGKLSEIMPPLVPALRTIRSLGGAWSYHAYTILYTTDPGVEVWYSLRYRQFYTYLRENYSDLGDMPMILTEAGVDEYGDPATSGWSARGDASKYQSWLQWFDSELQLDSYIVGAAIFQIGDTYWSSFNIEAISEWLANYLKRVVMHAFSPTDDTYVSSGSPKKVFGSASGLIVKSGASINNAYLKFKVANLTGPIRSARLRLYVTNASSDGGSVYAVSNRYNNSTTPWTEKGLTWRNAPSISGTPLAEAGAVSSGGWKLLPVTAAISGDGTYSFAIESSSSDAVAYSSKEGANPPRLIVETYEY